MSSLNRVLGEQALPSLRVVDLCRVRAHELRELWDREVRLWRERLDWDVEGAISALARAVERGGLAGKAVRAAGVTLGYTYYAVEGDRGVLSGLVVSPDARAPEVTRHLLDAAVEELERRRVRRIETQFISFDTPWLTAGFERAGFRTFWREFLRVPVGRPRPSRPPASRFALAPWSAWALTEMSVLMERAHRGGIDADMNELYRTPEGCRTLLNNIVRQRGCGRSLLEASSLARERGTDRLVGFALVTEIGEGHGHVAQVAVAPELQRQGVGHLLLDHTLARLSELGLERLSLMVSRGNEKALRLYRGMGFRSVCQFPVFSRER